MMYTTPYHSEELSKYNFLVTGGAGFIGSHVIRLFVNKYPNYRIINLDKLTYAGNLENLKDIEDRPNYSFVKGDINDADFITAISRSPNSVSMWMGFPTKLMS